MRRVSGGEIGCDRRFAPLAAKCPPLVGPDDRDRGTGFTQRFERSGQFAILESVFDENRHPLSSQRRRLSAMKILRGDYRQAPVRSASADDGTFDLTLMKSPKRE